MAASVQSHDSRRMERTWQAVEVAVGRILAVVAPDLPGQPQFSEGERGNTSTPGLLLPAAFARLSLQLQCLR
eukprot:jgi/Tetstr1/432748/TSEL_022114.t1